MPLLVAIPLIISGVKALLRFRGQIDTVLSVNEATAGLPFALPPIPRNDAPHLNDMLAFYKSDQGSLILQLKPGLQIDLALILPNPTSTTPAANGARGRLFVNYYEAAGVQPTFLGPSPADPIDKGILGISTPEMRLAYYTVESQRLSKNPVLTRVLLVSADTLLEFFGENAHTFISNPQTSSLVESLIEEFAGKRNFDDDGIEDIFKSLLGSTILAFANNPGELANKPALKALFAALGDVRDDLGNDFVAKIISVDGFEQLIAAYATEAAKDPSFLSKGDVAQDVLKAVLTKIGKSFPQIVDDPKALLGVLEVGIGAAAANVPKILEGKVNGEPLLAAVLSGVVQEVSTLGLQNNLFASIANGQVVSDIYKLTLQAVAANPPKFTQQVATQQFISDLIKGLANALSQKAVTDLFTPDTLKLIASESLTVLSTDAQFLTNNNQFATKILEAVFKAGSTAIADGVSKDDLIDIATVAIKATADNVALLNLNTQLAGAITSIGDAIAASGLQKLTNTQGRKTILLNTLQAVAANPVVWGQLQASTLVQPLVQAILKGLATDPAKLLSGSLLTESFSRILLAAVRRGQQLVSQTVQVGDIEKLLTLALTQANQEIGKSIDGENLPAFLERVVIAFIKAPFNLTTVTAANFKTLVASVLAELDN
ncbi:hypothetical protein GCM10028808_46970 [Spirosoma migulaei]